MFKTTNALVLREVRYKEADRILTLLTDSDGLISAKARGALRKSSKTAAATQQLTYSEMTLFLNKGKWSVNEATVTEDFRGLRDDIEKLALGCYFAECAESLSVEEQPDAELLQLSLNSLYALSRGMYPQGLIKAAFEFRLMCLAGYEPDLSRCCICGEVQPEKPVLMTDGGCLCCRDCRATVEGGFVTLCKDSLAALRYIASAPAKKLFSFTLGEEAFERLSNATESYIRTKTERKFSTLDYYKKVKIK